MRAPVWTVLGERVPSCPRCQDYEALETVFHTLSECRHPSSAQSVWLVVHLQSVLHHHVKSWVLLLLPKQEHRFPCSWLSKIFLPCFHEARPLMREPPFLCSRTVAQSGALGGVSTDIRANHLRPWPGYSCAWVA